MYNDKDVPTERLPHDLNILDHTCASLPHGMISAHDVLEEKLSPTWAKYLDKQHGNEELLHGLDVLGLAGPFYKVSPWELEDEYGVKRINAAGYAAMPFGEMPPELTQFLHEFLDKNRAMGLPQQSSTTWRAALQTNLIKLLASQLPSHADSQVFFASSGTEAIEGAMKFAKAARPKSKFYISFQRGYHGKTFGSLSLTPNPEYQDIFKPLVPGTLSVPYGDLEAFKTLVKRCGPDQVIAVVVEPIQGEGGVIIPPAGFLSGLGEFCQKHGIVVIGDEIQTGLGRTGHWFESANRGLDPDIITLAKPLGGGLVPVGATIVRQQIYKKMLGGLSSKRHSNTFGGGAMSMAVGLKSLEILMKGNYAQRSLTMGQQGLQRLQSLKQRYPKLLSEVRGQGMLMALQFQPMLGLPLPGALKDLMSEATAILAMREIHGAGVMPNMSLNSKLVVRLSPALNMPDGLFNQMFDRLDQFGAKNPNSRHILTNTPPKTIADLTAFATGTPKKRV